MSKIFKFSGAGMPQKGVTITQMKEVHGGWTAPMTPETVGHGKPYNRAALPDIMKGANTAKEKAERLVTYAQELSKNKFRQPEMELIRALATEHLTDAHGRFLPELQTALDRIDGMRDTFTKGASLRFQSTVAQVGAMQNRRDIVLAENHDALWQIYSPSLTNYMSTPELPKKTKYLVIGSGMTGTSAAMEFAEAGAGKDTLVLEESNAPARQATGRNGGNFEAMTENFYGAYEGLTKERYDFLKHYYRKANVPEPVLKYHAKKQADFHLEWAKRNTQRLIHNIEKNGIQCDFSPHGWTRIAEDAAEEAALKKEVEQLKAHGVNAEFWSPEEIKAKLDIDAKFGARVVPGNGNFHPVKYVDGLMSAAIKQGVGYYTNTKVLGIDATHPDKVIVHTNRGDIECEQLLIAANAFTRNLVPELDKIRPYISQVQDFNHVENTVQGQTVTAKLGDLYYNVPQATQYTDDDGVKRGTAHVGGGLDRPFNDPYHPKRSTSVMNTVFDQAGAVIHNLSEGERQQPPYIVSVGQMAFSDDRWPSIGHVSTPTITNNRVTVAQGCNGYGNTQAGEAGGQGARVAMAGKAVAEVPESMVSPNRLQTEIPMFEIDGLLEQYQQARLPAAEKYSTRKLAPEDVARRIEELEKRLYGHVDDREYWSIAAEIDLLTEMLPKPSKS